MADNNPEEPVAQHESCQCTDSYVSWYPFPIFPSVMLSLSARHVCRSRSFRPCHFISHQGWPGLVCVLTGRAGPPVLLRPLSIPSFLFTGIARGRITQFTNKFEPLGLWYIIQHAQQPCVNPALICDWCKDGGCAADGRGLAGSGMRARRREDRRHRSDRSGGGGFGPFGVMMPFPGPFF